MLNKFDIINIKYRDRVATTWYDDRDTMSHWLQLFGVASLNDGGDPRFKVIFHNPPILFNNIKIHIEIQDTGKPFIPSTLPYPLQGL